jgi:hypothetical protein
MVGASDFEDRALDDTRPLLFPGRMPAPPKTPQDFKWYRDLLVIEEYKQREALRELTHVPEDDLPRPAQAPPAFYDAVEWTVLAAGSGIVGAWASEALRRATRRVTRQIRSRRVTPVQDRSMVMAEARRAIHERYGEVITWDPVEERCCPELAKWVMVFDSDDYQYEVHVSAQYTTIGRRQTRNVEVIGRSRFPSSPKCRHTLGDVGWE